MLAQSVAFSGKTVQRAAFSEKKVPFVRVVCPSDHKPAVSFTEGLRRRVRASLLLLHALPQSPGPRRAASTWLPDGMVRLCDVLAALKAAGLCKLLRRQAVFCRLCSAASRCHPPARVPRLLGPTAEIINSIFRLTCGIIRCVYATLSRFCEKHATFDTRCAALDPAPPSGSRVCYALLDSREVFLFRILNTVCSCTQELHR